MLLNKDIQHIHCIGIGGIGMSAIAALLHDKGYRVTGSDIASSSLTGELEKRGVNIVYQHHEKNIEGADLIIYSSAIKPSNVEMVAARKIDVPTARRAEMLVELMQSFKSITVAGTHGKTTTTSLITQIFKLAGLDPSFMVGGIVYDFVDHVSLGQGEYFVSETDESDASFLYFSPYIAVVTNIEPDHLNTYDGDFEKLKCNFLKFLSRVHSKGFCILGIDSPAVVACIPEIAQRTITYGFHSMAEYRGINVKPQGLQTDFEVVRPRQNNLQVRLNLPGDYNVQNALAAIAIASELGIPDDIIQKALMTFGGVKRRFNIHGEKAFANGNAILIDDYGHHPTALACVLSTVRKVFPNRRIVLVFQPHRYSRTQELFQEFVKVLKKPNVLVLTKIYSAGEAPIDGVSSKRLYEQISKLRKDDIYLTEHLSEVPNLLNEIVMTGDIVVFQGAGDIVKLSQQLIVSS
jgi:UDP-N-acetylmuramate--alanine ligase